MSKVIQRKEAFRGLCKKNKMSHTHVIDLYSLEHLDRTVHVIISDTK